MTMRWRHSTLLREAVLNQCSGGVRSVVLIVVVSLSIFVPAVLEAVTVHQLVERDVEAERRGAFVLRVSASPASPVPLTAGSCEKLADAPGILASGSVLDGGMVALDGRPSTRVRRIRVTAGLVRVARLGTRGPWSGLPEVYVGADLSRELSLLRGAAVSLSVPAWAGRVAVVDEVISVRSLLPESARAVVEVSAPVGVASDCYVEVEPTVYEFYRGGALLGMLEVDGGSAVIADLLPRGSGPTVREAYHDRLSRWGFAGGSIVLVLVGVMARHVRGSQIAVYRTSGSSRPDLALLLALESIVVVVMGSAVAVVALAVMVAAFGVSRAVVGHGVHVGGLAALLGLFADVVCAAAFALPNRSLARLKDR